MGDRRDDAYETYNIKCIWMDKVLDVNNTRYRKLIKRVKSFTHDFITYNDASEYITSTENLDGKNCLVIIYDSLEESMFSCIHTMLQIDSIFIFCENKQRYESWWKDYSKIKGIFTDVTLLCQSLNQTSIQYERNMIPISFVHDSTVDRLDPSFMYTQILKEILLTIDFNEKHFKEFIRYCQKIFHSNDLELKNIKSLEKEYYSSTPIRWYTWNAFLYHMLNGALRSMDVDIIIRMGFFIAGLYRQIEQLHLEQFGTNYSNGSFLVYRGQGLNRIDFDEMKKSKGRLISFNNFLSTSKDRTASKKFALKATINPNLIGILFIIKIDPNQSTTSFASIADLSWYPKEHEVLFSMHAVFRLGDIEIMKENDQLYEVNLILTNETDEDLLDLTARMREEINCIEKGWFRLGSLLLTLNRFDKAEGVYNFLLKQKLNEDEKVLVYNSLGEIKRNQKDFKKSVKFYKKALDIDKNSTIYNNIGLVYYNLENYRKALENYNKAIRRTQLNFKLNEIYLSSIYNNIALVYGKMYDYGTALNFHQKALKIQEDRLPENHRDIAMSCNNIGMIYYYMCNSSEAHAYLQRAVNIGQYSLEVNHPHFLLYKDNFELMQQGT